MASNTRNPGDGVSLASIVAKETTEAKWRGSGGGLGFGTGGIGVFVGGMSGTKREVSQRAKELQPPPESSFNWGYVYGPALGMIGMGVLFSVFSKLLGSDVLGGVTSAGTGPVANAQKGISELLPILGTVIPLILMILAGVYFLYGGFGRGDQESKRYAAAQKADKFRAGIYHRLRYVEADHVVFDPRTGDEVAAERHAVVGLIDKLAREEAEADDLESGE
jgi:hypothetical protein